MDIATLKELFIYDPVTGDLFFRDNGKKITSKDRYGYLRSRRFGKFLQAHRVIWALTSGYWPNQIDHINGNPSDNRLQNLREVDYRGNGKNRKKDTRNTTGITGVTRKGGGYQAQIKSDGSYKYLYSGNDFFEACCRRKSAELEFNFHQNHGNRE